MPKLVIKPYLTSKSLFELFLTAESAEGAEFALGNFYGFSAPPRFNKFCQSISINPVTNPPSVRIDGQGER